MSTIPVTSPSGICKFVGKVLDHCIAIDDVYALGKPWTTTNLVSMSIVEAPLLLLSPSAETRVILTDYHLGEPTTIRRPKQPNVIPAIQDDVITVQIRRSTFESILFNHLSPRIEQYIRQRTIS